MINKDEKEPKKTNGYQIFQSSDCEDSLTDEASTCNETDEELTETSSRPVTKIILQFFWSSIEGDFAWPVASFPVNKLNAKTLGNCVWSIISILSELKFGRNNDKKVQALYGVCDGATHSSAFFNQYGSTNWMTENPFNNNNPIFWLSDPPHMIKKLRNFLISQKRNLKYNNYDILLITWLMWPRGAKQSSHQNIYFSALGRRCQLSVLWKHALGKLQTTYCITASTDIPLHS